MVTGLKIEFDTTPFQTHNPSSTKLRSCYRCLNCTPTSRRVINTAPKELGDYISQIFLTSKRDGTFRMVLNLKSLNTFVTYHHFTMDTVWTAINMMKLNSLMASIELKDAYYSVPICQDHQKFLKFSWKG